MTRKTKRKLEQDIQELKAGGPSDIEVSSTVVTITDDMTDESGNVIEESRPDIELLDGYTRGGRFGIQSDVVDVSWLEPTDE